MRSVKELDLPIGTPARAFLIQKTSMKGKKANPKGIQPMGSWRQRRTMPPMRRIRISRILRIITGGVFRIRFSRARWMRGFFGSNETCVAFELFASFMVRLLRWLGRCR